jgi:hypothetical protein
LPKAAARRLIAHVLEDRITAADQAAPALLRQRLDAISGRRRAAGPARGALIRPSTTGNLQRR